MVSWAIVVAHVVTNLQLNNQAPSCEIHCFLWDRVLGGEHRSNWWQQSF